MRYYRIDIHEVAPVEYSPEQILWPELVHGTEKCEIIDENGLDLVLLALKKAKISQ